MFCLSERISQSTTNKMVELLEDLAQTEKRWNDIPFFHVMKPGSIAPCSAHDFQGGIAKDDISEVFKRLTRSNLMNWTFLQNG